MINPDLITTVRVGELAPEPFLLTDLIPHEVGTDLKSGTVQQLLDLLRPLVGKLQYEVITLDVTTQYITDNFDSTGLGKNLCFGFAICNGNNGTKNRDGRTGIAYGANYSFVGFTGGATTHTLLSSETPPLTVSFTGSNDDNGGEGQYIVTSPNQPNTLHTLSSNGGGGSHNNMQPYIVELTIMKL